MHTHTPEQAESAANLHFGESCRGMNGSSFRKLKVLCDEEQISLVSHRESYPRFSSARNRSSLSRFDPVSLLLESVKSVGRGPGVLCAKPSQSAKLGPRSREKSACESQRLLAIAATTCENVESRSGSRVSMFDSALPPRECPNRQSLKRAPLSVRSHARLPFKFRIHRIRSRCSNGVRRRTRFSRRSA